MMSCRSRPRVHAAWLVESAGVRSAASFCVLLVRVHDRADCFYTVHSRISRRHAYIAEGVMRLLLIESLVEHY